jgi:hypothetical protein
MWRRVYLPWTDVSEERIASIFRVEKSAARNQREQVAGSSLARSNAGIVGSYLTQGMVVCIVCVYSVFVLFCV